MNLHTSFCLNYAQKHDVVSIYTYVEKPPPWLPFHALSVLWMFYGCRPVIVGNPQVESKYPYVFLHPIMATKNFGVIFPLCVMQWWGWAKFWFFGRWYSANWIMLFMSRFMTTILMPISDNVSISAEEINLKILILDSSLWMVAYAISIGDKGSSFSNSHYTLSY